MDRQPLHHFGPESVFEAEEIGLTLAAKLIATEPELTFPISISIDNQAVILSGESLQSNPGSYLADRFYRLMRQVKKQHRRDFDVTVRWVPGHSDIFGNEEADREAKKAAEGPHRNSPPHLLPSFLRKGPLPLSISALHQEHHKTLQARWLHSWQRSPRHTHLTTIDPDILNRSFIKLTKSFPRRVTSLLIGLCTGHIPLNRHLHRIKKVATPYCPHCPHVTETVHHLLIDCQHYAHARQELLNALGRNASSIQYLLSDQGATQNLILFINATDRLKATYGDVPIPM
jgi:hypothetical protein